ncbi:MAG: tetratricopeptide repeat protein, partial [Desulfovibrionaceae bacterium]|nr:tetratricopeptide repeat protein [Desulfovibrionaceae bacterium]
QAADQFQYIVQNYPDSQFVREASVGLARSLYKLEYFDQAFQIVDYIERRWPRFYMEYPPILEMIGDASQNMGKLEDARNRYWLYYNLDPSSPDAPDMLTRIGDIYLQEKKSEAAREVYEEAARKFPEHDAGLIAQMRLAEEGIYDAPSIGDMFSVFDRPYTELPYQTYSRIVKEHGDSRLAPLAQLKLAIWHLWNKHYTDALTEATAFAEKYPEHALLPKAREVALAAFSSLTADSVTEKEYDRILHAWDQFPIIQKQEEVIGGESRLALAYSEWDNQRSADALETLEPFFRGSKDFSYGEPALNLALTILVDSGQWQAVSDLYRKVEMWELTPDTQRQLDYSMALAAENMRNYDQATALWDSLRNQTSMPPEQKIYMFYFLAKAAERNKDMEQAYYLGRDALQGLMNMADENPEMADVPKIKDLLAMLMNITEGAGRITEALDWQQQYAQYIDEDSPDYLAMRYRLGQLYRQSGDKARWALVMQELVELSPDSLYGRMAASELRSSQLSNDISSFLPPGGM